MLWKAVSQECFIIKENVSLEYEAVDVMIQFNGLK